MKAECEDTTNIGRIDVRLLRKSSDLGLAYWVILELKVIKSFRNAQLGETPTTVNDSVNVAAIVDGVRQVGGYRAKS